ncbi:hypothetical protein CKO12_09540 [Chromatium okenii]|uniref:hypothetical protein n=1 Tax=Chromatium okenii TaxID=61644 RepID=UPI0019075087|nr:hypothetical protein [Chromatium okenii]MBK1642114.1 hypothetical protein [Chromatium okenii]
MSIENTLATYNRIRQIYKLPEMALTAVTFEVKNDLTPELAWQALCEFQPLEGWFQFQSHADAFINNAVPQPKQDWGRLLDAEVFDSENKRSLSLRTLSFGTIRLTIATAGTGEKEFLADDVKQLATRRTKHEWLCYRRYWRHDEELGFMPFYAAFQGFSVLIKEDAEQASPASESTTQGN